MALKEKAIEQRVAEPFGIWLGNGGKLEGVPSFVANVIAATIADPLNML